MQRLEVSGAVRPIYRSLGVEGLKAEKIILKCLEGRGLDSSGWKQDHVAGPCKHCSIKRGKFLNQLNNYSLLKTACAQGSSLISVTYSKFLTLRTHIQTLMSVFSRHKTDVPFKSIQDTQRAHIGWPWHCLQVSITCTSDITPNYIQYMIAFVPCT